MPVKKTTKKSSKPKTTTKKKTATAAASKKVIKNTNYIELSADSYAVLEHIKEHFEELTQTENMEMEDVIMVLVQGFIQSMHAEHGASGDKEVGCCGGGCGCG